MLTKNSSKLLRGKYLKALVGAFIYVTTLILVLLIPYAGLILSPFAFGYLTVNFIKYFNNVINNKNPKLYMLFVPNDNFATITFLGVLMVVMVLLGSLLFIIPGILFIAYNSMSLFVIEQENSKSVLETFRSCSGKMKDRKLDMLSYKIYFYFAYALLLLVFGLLFLLLTTISNSYGVLAVFLLIILSILTLAGLSVITLHFHAANTMFYIDVLNKEVFASKASSNLKAESKSNSYPKSGSAVNEEKVIDNAINNNDFVKKPATPKTGSSKKPPVKK